MAGWLPGTAILTEKLKHDGWIALFSLRLFVLLQLSIVYRQKGGIGPRS